MEKEYRRTRTTVSMINYHLIFCPRYRRKIFLINGVEERFKELVKTVCEKMNIEIIAMECDKDHTHIFLNALPTYSPAEIVKQIKGTTARALRSEFTVLSKAYPLWTRSYFVSTAGEVSSDTIIRYIESQKKRG